jgi:hypothetical protein
VSGLIVDPKWDTSEVDKWGAPLYGDPCRECGFTWATGQAGSIALMREMPDDVEQLVAGATGTELRSDLSWNVSGYIAHMTDNTRIWAERLIAVAQGAGAHVVPYDPDLLAEARHYNEIALRGATWSFRISVANWLAAVEEAAPAEIVMLHSERGAMELTDVVASNAHDAFHHCWDLRRILHSP